MAGLYFHIPFCKKKCYYCDFYSSNNISLVNEFIVCLEKEILLKKNFLSDKIISTIYFGGGTPSLLTINQLEKILNFTFKNFKFSAFVEISIEVNPENASLDYLKELNNLKFNRISIGVQSLDDNILKFLNRHHSANTAIQSVLYANTAGFENITVDLIYSIPGLSLQLLEDEMTVFFNLPVSHLSAYQLGIEKNTVLNKFVEDGKIFLLDEDSCYAQYLKVLEISEKYGFEQYELSNFAKNNKISLHNTNYWNGTEYLGFGPSAHSFYKNYRSWNIANLKDYIFNVNNFISFFDEENLSEHNLFNEKIMLSLRTNIGLDLNYLENLNSSFFKTFSKNLKLINSNYYTIFENKISLTTSGQFISDFIISLLFV
ncbi:MAG: radical SAM family heme chaperone HemW [Bacteroidales bacterium]|jgi:oxygen-independent coproporphyrinogen-3 oxidase|nr:radical SAM family heme chaperone HemW [Bacteroidales bacterium]